MKNNQIPKSMVEDQDPMCFPKSTDFSTGANQGTLGGFVFLSNLVGRED